jgi:predicted Zn-dependent protease
MKARRLILPIATLGVALFLVLWIVVVPAQPSFVRSFSPLFRALGVGGLSLNNLITRSLPIADFDEAAWGELYRENQVATDYDPTVRYLNQVMEPLAEAYGRPALSYQVWIADTEVRNAWALAGGNIIITRGLLDQLGSEAELAAILLHELAHIERGHCLALVRSEILSRKSRLARPLEALDFLISTSLRAQFSKTQEDEADQWAFDTLTIAGYHPQAMAQAFRRLVDEALPSNADEQGLFRDWQASHPDVAQRISFYETRGKILAKSTPAGGWRIGIRAYAEQDTSAEDEPGEPAP